MTRRHRPGTYQDFKKFTLDVVKGKRQVEPKEPKIWVESTDPANAGAREVQFHSHPDDCGACTGCACAIRHAAVATSHARNHAQARR